MSANLENSAVVTGLEKVSFHSNPKEGKNTRKDIFLSMFITVLFTRPKTWKQPKCPSMDEWLKIR